MSVRHLLLAAALALVACHGESAPSTPPAAAPPPPPVHAAPIQAEVAPAPPPHERTPEELFTSVGCANCHRPGAAFNSKLIEGRTKSVDELAQWIRHPEKVKPGTAMPSYANLVTDPEARGLASWIKAGNPK